MELISWKSVKDISGDGGVVKTVKQAGEGWEKPGKRDEVTGALTPFFQRAHRCRISLV